MQSSMALRFLGPDKPRRDQQPGADQKQHRCRDASGAGQPCRPDTFQAENDGTKHHDQPKDKANAETTCRGMLRRKGPGSAAGSRFTRIKDLLPLTHQPFDPPVPPVEIFSHATKFSLPARGGRPATIFLHVFPPCRR